MKITRQVYAQMLYVWNQPYLEFCEILGEFLLLKTAVRRREDMEKFLEHIKILTTHTGYEEDRTYTTKENNVDFIDNQNKK